MHGVTIAVCAEDVCMCYKTGGMPSVQMAESASETIGESAAMYPGEPAEQGALLGPASLLPTASNLSDKELTAITTLEREVSRS